MPNAAHLDFHARHFAPTAYRTEGNRTRGSFRRPPLSQRTKEKRAAEARSAAAGVCPACFERRSIAGTCSCA